MSEYYVGLMSGTSMDGIDAVVVDFSSSKTPKLICTYSHPLPVDVYRELLASRELADDKLNQLHALDIRLGEIFAEATLALLDKAKLTAKDIVAIGNHGQTIRHRPDADQPFSLQIGDAKTLAQKTGIRVISDFRTADIKAGGQGAPLAPAFHKAVFQSETETRGILNIGGIANITVLPADKSLTVTGFDTGPGNNMMDAWMAKTHNKNFDKNGEFARSGQINEDLLNLCLSDVYFKTTPPKSTGFEQFNLDWFNQQLKNSGNEKLNAADRQATLCELTARSIADAVVSTADINHLLVCGGGVHNSYLMGRIQLALPNCKVESSEVCGVHPDWVEAMAFAWLAKRTINQQTGNLPSVTGAKKAVMLGSITSVYP
ncbi:MAG: anhydro-N-acetylmuramic acid kinase [Gammaproteobacteria bacterium]|nr:anhydro-N-acetylmuramic acid kinase [Gammaproteobacteria bacterium]